MADKIKITILSDGTIKMETDEVSLPNHVNAEGFLREISRLAGGESEIKFKNGFNVVEKQDHHHAKH